MLEPATAEAWIGLVGGSLALAAAAIGLGNAVFQARRRPQVPAQPDGLSPPPPPPPPGESKHVLLPGRAPFVNRSTELHELLARIRGGRNNVLAIEGAHWIGKSATATELAHCLLTAPAEGAFDPRVHSFLRINADDRCPSLADICGKLALLTDDQSLSSTAEDEKRERLRVHLGSNRTVLLLDNLSLEADERSQALIDLLRDFPSGSLAIAAVNKPGELDAPAVALADFDQSCVRKLVDDLVIRLNLEPAEDFGGDFASRLHRLIGGNPGMIEWFLRSYDKHPQGLEERLVAVEKGSGLSEIFDSTWGGLDERSRTALAACAFLGGEASARQLAVACGWPEETVHEVADLLRRDGLLTPVRASARPLAYSCAQAFRLFVASQTTTDEHTAFMQRLCDDYVAYFTSNPEDAHFAVPEVGALRVVRGELYDAEDDARMQSLFRATLDILFTLGQFDELIASAELTFRSAERAGNYAAGALAAAIKSCTHAIRGETRFATDAYAQASKAAEASKDQAAIARVRRCRAFLHYRSREPREALAAIEGVEEVARAAHDHVNVVDVLDLRTAASWYEGDLEACEEAAHASLEAGAAVGWGRARAYPLRYMCELAIQRREYEQAHALIDEAAEIATRYGDKRQLARVSLTRARLGLLELDLPAAGDAASFAAREARRLGLSAESEEALAVEAAVDRARRSRFWRRYYAWRRPARLTEAPVGGD
jgi:hypothetical protein